MPVWVGRVVHSLAGRIVDSLVVVGGRGPILELFGGASLFLWFLLGELILRLGIGFKLDMAGHER